MFCVFAFFFIFHVFCFRGRLAAPRHCVRAMSDHQAFSQEEILSFLSPEARAALAAHAQTKAAEAAAVDAGEISEDFGKSQFWYSEDSARLLAEEALSVGGKLDDQDRETPRSIALISCPSVFKALKSLLLTRSPYSSLRVLLFEYDERFHVYGEEFVMYDYNAPEAFPAQLKHSFDFIMADPPYLSEECMKKTALTMKLLARDRSSKLVFNTGAIMTRAIALFADLFPLVVQPRHGCLLMNEFKSFANYESMRLGGFEDKTKNKFTHTEIDNQQKKEE